MERHPTLEEDIWISYSNPSVNNDKEIRSPPRDVVFTLHNTGGRSYYIRITQWEVGMPNASEYKRLKAGQQWLVQYQYLSVDCTLRIYREGSPDNILIQEIPVKQYIAGVIPTPASLESSTDSPEDSEEDEDVEFSVPDIPQPAEPTVTQGQILEDSELPLEEEPPPFEGPTTEETQVLKREDEDLLTKFVEGIVSDLTKEPISQIGEIKNGLVELQNTIESLPTPDAGNKAPNSALGEIREYYVTLENASRTAGLMEQTDGAPLVDDELKTQLESIVNVASKLNTQINSSPIKPSQDTEDLIDEFEEKLRNGLIGSQPIACDELKPKNFSAYKSKQIKDYCKKAENSTRKISAPTYLEIEEGYKRYVDNMYQSHFSAQISPTKIQQKDLEGLIAYFVEGVDLLKRGEAESKDNMALLNSAIEEILDIAGIEETPVAISRTIADEEEHDIYDTRTGNYANGVILDVVVRGLRKKKDKRLIRKPAVVRARRQRVE